MICDVGKCNAKAKYWVKGTRRFMSDGDWKYEAAEWDRCGKHITSLLPESGYQIVIGAA